MPKKFLIHSRQDTPYDFVPYQRPGRENIAEKDFQVNWKKRTKSSVKSSKRKNLSKSNKQVWDQFPKETTKKAVESLLKLLLKQLADSEKKESKVQVIDHLANYNSS